MDENKCPMCGESYIIAKPTKWGGMEYIHGMSETSIVSCQQSSASYKAAQQSVQATGGESAANLSLFPAEVESPAKVTRQSTRA